MKDSDGAAPDRGFTERSTGGGGGAIFRGGWLCGSERRSVAMAIPSLTANAGRPSLFFPCSIRMFAPSVTENPPTGPPAQSIPSKYPKPATLALTLTTNTQRYVALMAPSSSRLPPPVPTPNPPGRSTQPVRFPSALIIPFATANDDSRSSPSLLSSVKQSTTGLSLACSEVSRAEEGRFCSHHYCIGFVLGGLDR